MANEVQFCQMSVNWHYSHKQIIHDYTLHQQTLENVQSSKYLGITITENMDWVILRPKQLRQLDFRFPLQECQELGFHS